MEGEGEEEFEYEPDSESESDSNILDKLDKALVAVRKSIAETPTVVSSAASIRSSTSFEQKDIQSRQFEHWNNALQGTSRKSSTLSIGISETSDDNRTTTSRDSTLGFKSAYINAISTSHWLKDKLESSVPYKPQEQPRKIERSLSSVSGTSSNASGKYSNRTSSLITPTMIRKKQMTFSSDDIADPVIQSKVSDEDLKRSASFPLRRNSRVAAPQFGKVTDVAVLSLKLGKRNRKGKFQPRYFLLTRLIRIDGTLLVCMGAKKSTINTGSIMDYNLLHSSFASVNDNLEKRIKENYPSGTEIPSLAKVLMSRGNTDSPEPRSPMIFIPKVFVINKWVIPIIDIKTIDSKIDPKNPESAESRTFKLITNTGEYCFQAESLSQLERLKYMLDCIIHLSQETNQVIKPTQSVIANYAGTDTSFMMQKYQEQQRIWKKVLHYVVLQDMNFKRNVITMKINTSKIEVLQGVVLQPTMVIPKIEKPKIVGGFSTLKRSTLRKKNLKGFDSRASALYSIDSQLEELESELALLDTMKK
jgi:hypothetical protein